MPAKALTGPTASDLMAGGNFAAVARSERSVGRLVAEAGAAEADADRDADSDADRDLDGDGDAEAEAEAEA
ncbi:MAG: hypothetical protein ABIV63_14260, partial [Caldimonas sp.]